jgi:methyl-accepting chemotaxis protein
LVLGLVSLLAGVAQWQVGRISGQLIEVAAKQERQTGLVQTMVTSVHEYYIALFAAVVVTNQDDVEDQQQQIDRQYKAYRDAEQDLRAVVSADPQAADLVALLDELRGTAETVSNQAAAVRLAVGDPSRRESNGTSVAYTMRIVVDEWLNGLRRLQTLAVQRGEQANAQASADASAARTALVVLAALAMAVGLLASVTISRSVVRPLHRAVAVAERVAQGDLAQPINADRGTGEVAVLMRTLGQMQAGLHKLVSQVRETSSSVAVASSEIASGNQSLSSRTEETAGNLQQASSAMLQLTENIRQSAESARIANELADGAAAAAQRGGEAVAQVIVSMEQISTASQRIADITGVIDSIAFQTNILALNAAVEAARAGEQGRGFAVVAAEVRNLASRSAQAAREIKDLIGQSVDTVDSGAVHVRRAGATMDEILASVHRATEVISGIAAATGAQSGELAHVSRTVSDIDRMTQQNAAMVEQCAAAAGSLHEQTQRLEAMISVFQVDPHELISSPGLKAAGCSRITCWR